MRKLRVACRNRTVTVYWYHWRFGSNLFDPGRDLPLEVDLDANMGRLKDLVVELKRVSGSKQPWGLLRGVPANFYATCRRNRCGKHVDG